MLYSEKMKATDKGGCRPSFKKRKEYSDMDRVKKNFVFGCMLLPMQNGEIDLQRRQAAWWTRFLDAGFNYFDTAHGYLQGKS